jgi:hypothetical protein
MTRNRKAKPFYLIIIDEDRRVFNVVGPLHDDEEWNSRVVEMQNKGRKVRCFSRHEPSSRDLIIAETSQGGPYKYSDRLIIDRPEDKSAEYGGQLPSYARNANRKRVVQILCRGICRGVRWGEMNTDYPGEVILKNSQAPDFSARCLKCGYIAKDPYNWYR